MRARPAAVSPLAARLFEIDGVTGVFLGSDFVSVTKSGGEWQHLTPAVLGAIMEHFLSGEPVLFAGDGAAAQRRKISTPRTPRWWRRSRN